jgi:hypothetical protein
MSNNYDIALHDLTEQIVSTGVSRPRAREMARLELEPVKPKVAAAKGEPQTMFSHQVNEPGLGGRYANLSQAKPKVVGSGEVIPPLPSTSPWSEPVDLSGVEQPFPGDVSYVEPVGELHEQQASIARSEALPLPDRAEAGSAPEGSVGPASPPSEEERRHQEMVDTIHNELLQRSEASRGEGFYERQALIKVERGRGHKGESSPMRIAVAPPDPAIPRRAELIAALEWSPDWKVIKEFEGGAKRFEYIGIRNLLGKDYDFDALLERYRKSKPGK